MKKRSIVFFAFIAMSINAQAQINSGATDNRSKPQFGLKVGLNYANVYDAKGEEFRADGKFGAAGGFFASIPIGSLIGLQPEVLFSQKGFQATGVIFGSSYEFTRTTNYLDVPLYFAFKPSEFITVLAGPQFSYLMSSKDVFVNGFTTIEQEEEFENDNIRKNTASFSIGADINLKHIVIGARAAWDLFDNKGDGTSSTPRYKNQWVQLTIGYTFYKAG